MDFIGSTRLLEASREVYRSQSEQTKQAVQWAELMNHFIESPEIVMFEGSEADSATDRPISHVNTATLIYIYGNYVHVYHSVEYMI